MLTYLSFPSGETEEELRDFYEKYINSSPSDCLYAIIDKANPEKDSNANYAGTIALSTTSPANASTEIGIMIFPAFQRSHVSSNAIGLLLQYTLDPPSAGGLGLRRVEWKCHAGNESSRRAALRMGFEFEGILRWERAFPGGAVGLPVDAFEKRNGTSGEALGRHTAIFSIVWDEWDEKRVKIVGIMERKS